MVIARVRSDDQLARMLERFEDTHSLVTELGDSRDPTELEDLIGVVVSIERGPCPLPWCNSACA